MDAASLQAAGWKPLEATGFTGYIAPLWIRNGEGIATGAGFIADERHVNYQETVHGGALMTFADIALGWIATEALGHKRCVTAQLAIQLVSAPRVGDFISCHAELVRKTSQLVFVRGLIVAGDRTLASADGIWKVLAPKQD